MESDISKITDQDNPPTKTRIGGTHKDIEEVKKRMEEKVWERDGTSSILDDKTANALLDLVEKQ